MRQLSNKKRALDKKEEKKGMQPSKQPMMMKCRGGSDAGEKKGLKRRENSLTHTEKKKGGE